MKEVLVFKSLYVLLLYLLITKEKNTLFITTSNIDKTILYNLKNKILLKTVRNLSISGGLFVYL